MIAHWFLSHGGMPKSGPIGTGSAPFLMVISLPLEGEMSRRDRGRYSSQTPGGGPQ